MESKEIFVSAHVRLIKQKNYRFVCKECNQVTERACYPSRPLYCQRCRPPKSTPKKEASVQSKKKPKAKQPTTSAVSSSSRKTASAKVKG